MTSNIFKPIPGLEKEYLAHRSGKIYSIKRKKFLKSENRISGSGYEYVSLKQKCISVHWCIATAFHGESHLEVNHINGNKRDNKPENLEWVNRKQNMRSPITRKHMLKVYKDRKKLYSWTGNPNSKLTTKNISKIKILLNKKDSQKTIAAIFKVTPGAISKIKRKLLQCSL